MKIGRVKINNFRSISKLEINLNTDINAFVGGNESGKSNILKAILKISQEEKSIPFSPEDYYNHETNAPEISVTFILESGKDDPAISIIGDESVKEFTITRIGESMSSTLVENPPIQPDEPELPAEGTEETTPAVPPVVATPVVLPTKLDQILPLIPKVIYFPSFEQEEYLIGRDLPLAELQVEPENQNRGVKTILDFLSLGNITISDLTIVSPRERLKKLIKGSSIIGKKMSQVWNQELVRVRIEVSDEKLVILVRDGKNIDKEDETSEVWTCPEDRSSGFQWFITFYSRFLANDKGNNTIMLDDAGLYLHATAQQDLLNTLKHLASSGNQIIYTTHSPYFLDKEEPHKIILIRKVHKDNEYGTQVITDWKSLKYSELPDPLREIGFTYLRQILQKRNLIVEGDSDQTYLVDISNIFKRVGLTSINFPKISIFPVNGASNSLPFAFLSKSEGLEVAILLDHDDAGIAAKQKAVAAGFEKVYTLRDVVSGTNKATIEDFIPLEKYLAAINETYRLCDSTWKDISIADIGATNPPRIPKIEKKIRENLGLPENSRFINKDLIAMKIIDDGLTVDDFGDEDKKAIQEMFTKINSMF